jgi:hypothetical protein
VYSRDTTSAIAERCFPELTLDISADCQKVFERVDLVGKTDCWGRRLWAELVDEENHECDRICGPRVSVARLSCGRPMIGEHHADSADLGCRFEAAVSA